MPEMHDAKIAATLATSPNSTATRPTRLATEALWRRPPQ
jgi:hypothetical protein